MRKELEAIVGPENVFSGEAIEERYRIDILRKYHSRPAYVVRPASVDQVADIVRLAARERMPVTPLGGRTGVTGGGACADGGVVLSLERMNRIREIDENSMVMTVEAGTTLQVAQEAAEAHGLMLPLDHGARGSATVGGAIATNAGGTRVLRWGMMRDMVLGLQAVLADGSVVTSLTKMLKDNAGYDWKRLLIGSEGTLGVVTAAVLRLRPLPSSTQTALLALPRFAVVPELLRHLQSQLAGQLSSFELMWDDFYQFVTEAQLPKRARPLAAEFPLYALVESMGAHEERDAMLLEEALTRALDRGLVKDVVLARSLKDRENLWAVRDELTEPFRSLFPLVSFDLSMPLAAMDEFRTASSTAIRCEFPHATLLYYGHAGDGNLHLVVSCNGRELAEERIEDLVYEVVRRLGGSISAEHGIGRLKRKYISFTRSAEEIALMRSIKNALDPENILNPGAVLPDA